MGAYTFGVLVLVLIFFAIFLVISIALVWII